VVPVLEPARTTVSLEVLPPAMGLQILERECQTPREEKWIAPWLLDRYPEAELTRARQVMLSRLAGSIPMAALRFGFDYDDPGVQAAILSSLSVLVDGGDQAPSMKARRSSSRKRSPSHSSA
ncbi:MAG: hypothetical protein M3357_05975, partial [Actinomycetota bacterium]|nr:hypothetical protein [Actinomycetota bacterium]